MRNPFDSDCKTKKQELEILQKAHLALPIINTDYMPDDLCEKRSELEELMLHYIWKWSKELEAAIEKATT